MAKQGDEASVLIMKKVSWKNKLKFVEDVFMVCVSLTIFVFVLPEKKKFINLLQACCIILNNFITVALQVGGSVTSTEQAVG